MSQQGKTEEQKDNDSYAKNFTRVPNILFESYRYITKEEVLLYIRLRYIYWDTKPRYLSLRELADITGYSTGALSKMLPRLTAVGLIHAEIRKKKGKDGKEKGNPVYHITINDIWEENRKFFTEGFFDPSEVLLVHQMNDTCSPNEQDNPQPVHQMNKPVHKMNDLVHQTRQGCSPNEQDQAQKEAHKITYKTSNKTSLQDKDTYCVAANADNTARVELSFSEEDYWNLDIPITFADARAYLIPHGPHEGLDAVQLLTLARKLWVEAHPPTIDDDPDKTQERIPAIPKQTNSVTLTPARVSPHMQQAAPVANDTPSQLSTSFAQEAHSNGQLAKGKTKAEKPAGPPVMPPDDAPWTTRTCMALFDARRGELLIGRWKNSQASECAKGLAEQHDRDYVVRAIALMEKEKYYIERGTSPLVDICDVAHNISKYATRLNGKPKGTPRMGVTGRPSVQVPADFLAAMGVMV